MKRFIAGILAVAATLSAKAGPDAQYLNNGVVTEAPQINALTFINRGQFDLSGVDLDSPFSTLNTEQYLNYGSIQALTGMRFQLQSESGSTGPSTSFFNAANASIVAIQPSTILSLNSSLNPYRDVPATYLSINAHSVTNRGLLQGTIGGEISITGDFVDLGRSAVDIAGFGSGDTSTGFTGLGIPLPGMRDVYWQYEQTRVPFAALFSATTSTNVALGVTNVETRITASSPTFPYTDVNTEANQPLRRRSINLGTGVMGQTILPFVWITTNPPSGTGPTNPATNQVITVVFVKRADTNVLVDAVAFPGLDPVNAPLPTIDLRFTKVATNLITGNADATVLKLRNTYGSAPDTLLVSNGLTGNTFWPTNLTFARQTITNVPNPLAPLVVADTNLYPVALSNLFVAVNNQGTFVSMRGDKTNAALRTNIFTAWLGGGITNALPYTNNGATNPFMAYSATFDFTATKTPKPALVPDASTTNLSGRIVINAKELDLTKVRMRAQGPVLIKADKVRGFEGATIDAPYVNADFGAPASLNLTGIFRSSVERFSGSNSVFSSIWTNTVDYTYTITNAPANPTDPPTTTDTTVTLQAIFHVMFVDASLIGKFQTPFVDLNLRAPTVVLGDQFAVHRLTASDATSFTVNGRLQVIGDDLGTRNWDATAFPQLLELVNNGRISVANQMVLGSDRGFGYNSIVNNGILTATYFEANSKSFVQGAAGALGITAGPVLITGDNVDISGAVTATGSAVEVNAKKLAFGTAALSLVGTDFVHLNATEEIRGTTNPVVFTVTQGFRLDSFPATATTTNWMLEVNAPNFQEAVITWPGLNKTAAASSLDNRRISSLSLDGGIGSTFTFAGTTTNKHALYVDILDLSTNLAGTNSLTGKIVVTADINMPSNFQVFFGKATLDGKPVDGAQVQAATGNKFTEISAGRFFSADVVELVNGKPTSVSRSIRYSAVLDSDGDGIVNALDATPFEGVVVQNAKVLSDGQPGFRITWEAGPRQAYEVQYTTDSAFGNWKTLQKVSNDSNDHQTLWVRDPIPGSDGARAYRVLYAQ